MRSLLAVVMLAALTIVAPSEAGPGSGRTDLVPMFFSAYARLQESGELNAIVERTLLVEDKEQGWRSWATQLAAALAIVGLAFLAMYAWSRSLRRQVRERTRELEQAVTDSREAAERVAFHAEESRTHARRQAAIAVLGQRALAGIDFELLVAQSCATAADVLGVPLVGLFEQIGGQSGLMLKAGLGWTSAQSGKAWASTNPECHLGYVFSTKAAVVASHGDADPRFAWEPLLAAESVVSSAAVIVPGREGCAGLIVVAAREPKMFTRDDLHFLQALANVIGASLERQLVEDELRRMLSLHRATLESTADGLIIVDHDFRVTSYNQRFAEMWQIRREILESGDGERILDAAVPLIDGDPHAIAAGVRAAHRGQNEEILTLTLKDGRVIERYSVPQRLGNDVIGRIWSFRDITARVTAQAEQRRLEVQIQHVQKLESLGVLAGGIAHDFNNLLVGILGHVGLALTDATPESALYERIAQIEIAAMRAAELTNQMLAYSGKGRFVVQPLDLSLVVREMSNLLQTAVTKTARLDLRLGADLPAIQADPVQLPQVVMNLITNASDAIGESQGAITVSTGRMHATREYLAESYLVSQVADGEYVYFDVRDDGCGMDEETRARIFDPFFTTKFAGRGLGLAAVLGIVRGHHGAIRIESTPGKGTAFRVLFPAAAAVAIPEATAPAAAAPARRDGCILVVDDEPSVLAVARETLKRAGFTVLTASDGLAAVEQFRNHAGTIDLVLMDMTMPRMSGVRAMHAIRAIRADACVMLTSGYTEQEAADRIDGDAPDGFIQKPYRPAALVQKIQDMLAGACTTVS